ncbi:hypothetical protein [Aeromonas veronii]|uniref:hypothetical protein n=1 Tax=Aeromonas veronii TaxID=654 RepID=UPI003D24E213
MKCMKLKERNGATYLSYKDLYPVMHETKVFVIISVFGFNKKVMLSTGKYPRALKTDPVFELVDVSSSDHYVAEIEQGTADMTPEISSDLLKRRPGRPKTGKALSPAEKQARYRARQAEKTVTVTFNRAHLSTLKTLLANAPQSLGLPADELDSLAKAVFDAALK